MTYLRASSTRSSIGTSKVPVGPFGPWRTRTEASASGYVSPAAWIPQCSASSACVEAGSPARSLDASDCNARSMANSGSSRATSADAAARRPAFSRAASLRSASRRRKAATVATEATIAKTTAHAVSRTARRRDDRRSRDSRALRICSSACSVSRCVRLASRNRRSGGVSVTAPGGEHRRLVEPRPSQQVVRLLLFCSPLLRRGRQPAVSADIFAAFEDPRPEPVPLDEHGLVGDLDGR